MQLFGRRFLVLLPTLSFAVGCTSPKPKTPAPDPRASMTFPGGSAATQATLTTAPSTQAAAPLDALVDGGLGAGGGYLIGVPVEKLRGQDREACREAAILAGQRAEQKPVTMQQAEKTSLADVNGDGFITVDEVVAMRRANVDEAEIADRLARTGLIFEVTEFQEDYLRTRGVGDKVIQSLRTLNHDAARVASAKEEVDGEAEQSSK